MKEKRIWVLLFLILVALLYPVSTLAEQEGANILFIFDASGSMQQTMEGKPKLKIAKEVLSALVGDLPKDAKVGLEAYGHREKTGCDDIEIVVPVGKLDVDVIKQKINSLEALGNTPIASALEMGADVVRGLSGKKTIILISDGEETCGGDPVGVTEKIKKEFGVDVAIHVIGFDVSEKEKQQLSGIAQAGGGKYYSADNVNQLVAAFDEVVKKEILGAPERKTAKATDIIFEDTFDKNFLRPDWIILDEDQDYIVMDEGVLVITQSSKKETDDKGKEKVIYPNTLKLDKPLPGNFEINVEWEIDFQSGRFWGQEIALLLVSENGNTLQAGFRYGDFGSAGSSLYLGRFITKWISGKKSEILNKGNVVGKGLGLQKVQVRLVKKKFEYAVYARKTGEDWTEVGHHKLLRFPNPRLQLMQYNWGKSGPEVEARIKHITIRKVE